MTHTIPAMLFRNWHNIEKGTSVCGHIFITFYDSDLW